MALTKANNRKGNSASRSHFTEDNEPEDKKGSFSVRDHTLLHQRSHGVGWQKKNMASLVSTYNSKHIVELEYLLFFFFI